MNKCKTCKYWRVERDGYSRAKELIFPLDPVTYEPEEDEDKLVALYGHRVRMCQSPRLLFFERPPREGASVIDASVYFAGLITGEDFGCTMHEAIDADGMAKAGK